MGRTSSIGRARDRRLTHWLVAFALLWASVSQAGAQDWTHRIRPGDTLWDLSGEYLKPGIPWQKLQSHNQISSPYQLPRGSTVGFPLAWLYTQPASTLPKLPAGTWYLGTQSNDSDGHEAPFPPAQSVQVPCRACHALVGSGAPLVLLVV